MRIISRIIRLVTGHFYHRSESIESDGIDSSKDGIDQFEDFKSALKRQDAQTLHVLCRGYFEKNGEDPNYCYFLGEAFFISREYENALRTFRRAAILRPWHVDTWRGIYLTLYELGDLDQSFLYANVLQKIPAASIDATSHVGLIHLRLGNIENAIERLRTVLRNAPDHQTALNNLGIAYSRCLDYPAAKQCFQKAVKLNPEYSTAWSNLGLCHAELSEVDASLECLNKAIRLKPDNPTYQLNYGVTLEKSGRIDEAADHIQSAFALKPRDGKTRLALIGNLFQRGQYDEAFLAAEEFFSLSPDNPEAAVCLAEFRIGRGEFSTGWELYEQRLRTENSPTLQLNVKRWEGEVPPPGKLLLYAEQGLGDCIFFAQCLPKLSSCSSISVEVPSRLTDLFRRSFPGMNILEQRESKDGLRETGLGGYDFAAPIGSLMHHFRKCSSDFSEGGGYLVACPEKRRAIRERLNNLSTRPKIGLVWKGGLFKTGRTFRSISLSQLAVMAVQAGYHPVSLQYGDIDEDLRNCVAETGIEVMAFVDATNDLDTLAALIAELDLIVSVPNTAAHLAGALGAPVYVLAPVGVSWRYMHVGNKVPWYASAEILRQTTPFIWEDVLTELSMKISDRP